LANQSTDSQALSSCCLSSPPTAESTLFPYTTLFRSRCAPAPARRRDDGDTPALLRAAGGRAEPRAGAHVQREPRGAREAGRGRIDRKSTRLNSSHVKISYAVFCLKKKNAESAVWLFS